MNLSRSTQDLSNPPNFSGTATPGFEVVVASYQGVFNAYGGVFTSHQGVFNALTVAVTVFWPSSRSAVGVTDGSVTDDTTPRCAVNTPRC